MNTMGTWTLLVGLVAVLCGGASASEPELVAEPIASMAFTHGNGGAVSYGGKLYVYSGPADGPMNTVVEIYDPGTNTWTRGADVPAARNAVCDFALNGRLYCIGGQGPSYGGFTNMVFRYDIAANRWDTLRSYVRTTWDSFAAVCGGKAYVMGGRTGYTRTYEDVYEYDEASDAWIRKADMPYSVFMCSAVAYGGKVYIFGGTHKDSEASTVYTKKIQIYDPAADSWETAPEEMPWQLMNVQAALLGDEAYLFAMSVWDDASGQWIRNEHVYRYTFADKTWLRYRFIPPAHMQCTNSIPVIGQYAYLTELDDNGTLKDAYKVALGAPGVADLAATRFEPSKTEATPGEQIDLSWEVQNVGTATTSCSWADAVYISRNDTLDGSDRMLLRVACDRLHPLAPTEKYAAEATFTIPTGITPAGLWYLIFKADSGDALTEPDKANNVRVRPIAILLDDTGDINKDGCINVTDLLYVRNRLGWGSCR